MEVAMTDDDHELNSLQQEIRDAILQSQEALRIHHRSQASGGANGQDVLLDSAIRLFNDLHHWRTDPGVKDIWSDNQLDEFGAMLDETVTVQPEARGMLTNPPDPVTMSKASRLQAQTIANVNRALLEVARELGFLPETSERTITEKGTLNDIRHLLTTREQDASLEAIEPPANDVDALPDGGVAVQTAQPSADELPGAQTDVAWRHPFRGPFFQHISDRKKKGQDAKISVASANAETGVGKSTCAFYLSLALDTSVNGFSVSEQATLNVKDFLSAYSRLSLGSALILDEAEQLTGRRAMSNQNVEAGEQWQMKRVREIIALITLPKFEVLDPLLKDLLDFRVEIEERGRATIYKKAHSLFSDTWWHPIQEFHYPNMDSTQGMQQLHDLKEEFISGATSDGYVPEDEFESAVDDAQDEGAKAKEKELVRQMSESGHSYAEIREVTGRSKSTISNWVNES